MTINRYYACSFRCLKSFMVNRTARNKKNNTIRLTHCYSVVPKVDTFHFLSAFFFSGHSFQFHWLVYFYVVIGFVKTLSVVRFRD